MNLVSPLNRVLGLGVGRGAGEHWWLQRVTAVALVVLGLWFALALLGLPDFSYATVAGWARRPLASILLVLLVPTAGYHSYLGVRVVIEDYVASSAGKVASLIASAFAHAALTIAAVFAVLTVAFGPIA